MKFVWRGKYKGPEDLSIGNLPEGATKYKEPKDMVMLNLYATFFLLPIMILIGIGIAIKFPDGLGGEYNFFKWLGGIDNRFFDYITS